MKQFYDLPVIDSHVHLSRNAIASKMGNIDNLFEIMNVCGFSAMNVVNIVLWQEQNLLRNPLSVLMKALCPDRIYTFGGLVFPPPQAAGKYSDYAEQAKLLADIGYDGIKMFSKPTVRGAFGEPMDSPIYDEFFSYVQSKSIPVLYHVADPATFWDIHSVPKWAMEQGWFYGDGNFPGLETFYKEVEGFLVKYPGLKIVLPHFYFMSGDMERAGAFLDRWPHVLFDITPGTEMYADFTKNPGKWAEFFTKYQDRIMFGTDIFGGDGASDKENVQNAVKRIEFIRTFLETDREFKYRDIHLKGIKLDKDILAKIYAENFRKLAGIKPKKLDLKAAIFMCGHVLDKACESSLREEIIPQMHEIIKKLQVLSGENHGNTEYR